MLVECTFCYHSMLCSFCKLDSTKECGLATTEVASGLCGNEHETPAASSKAAKGLEGSGEGG